MNRDSFIIEFVRGILKLSYFGCIINKDCLFVSFLYFCEMGHVKTSSVKKIKVFRYSLLFIFSWVLLHICFISWDGLKNSPDPADVAVVLGSTVFNDGTVAQWTKGRLDRALELFNEGKVKSFFVSGGHGIEYHYPEATAMKAYLLAHGVPDSMVTADNDGENTYLTAVNFNKWNKERKTNKIIVVSQFFHITRSKYIITKMGYKGQLYSASSKVKTWKDMLSLFREVVAFYKYVLIYREKEDQDN